MDPHNINDMLRDLAIYALYLWPLALFGAIRLIFVVTRNDGLGLPLLIGAYMFLFPIAYLACLVAGVRYLFTDLLIPGFQFTKTKWGQRQADLTSKW